MTRKNPEGAYYVLSPIKVGGRLVRPSGDRVDIPKDQVEELLVLGFISDSPATMPGAASAANAGNDSSQHDAALAAAARLDELQAKISGVEGELVKINEQKTRAADGLASALEQQAAAEQRAQKAGAEADTAEARLEAAKQELAKLDAPATDAAETKPSEPGKSAKGAKK